MTQVKSAQPANSEVALRGRLSGRSLAQRRAEFAAQMRAMALSDLSAVSDRLKSLHKELEIHEEHRITQYTLANEMGIPPRTFQSWEGGEVENRDGKGYDKIARYYSRKLGRKITRNWILFGDRAIPAAQATQEPRAKVEQMELEEISGRLSALEAGQAKILRELAALRRFAYERVEADVDEARGQPRQRPLEEHDEEAEEVLGS